MSLPAWPLITQQVRRCHPLPRIKCACLLAVQTSVDALYPCKRPSSVAGTGSWRAPFAPNLRPSCAPLVAPLLQALEVCSAPLAQAAQVSGSSRMQPRSDTDAEPAEPPECDALLDLLPDVIAIIVNKLTRESVREFAATSSAAFTLVLERRADLVEFCVDTGLECSIARLRSCMANSHRSVVRITSRLRLPPPHQEKWARSWHMRMPLHAAIRVCSPGSCILLGLPHSVRALSPATMRAVLPYTTRLQPTDHDADHDGDWLRTAQHPGKLCVPPGMSALKEVSLEDCRLPALWLPASSAASVRTLHLAGSTLQRIPVGMTSLQEVDVGVCRDLAADGWLPSSSAASVRMLTISSSSVRRLPKGMRSLQEVRANFCQYLVEDWLPASSGTALRKLVIKHSPLLRVPATATALHLCRRLVTR